MPTGCRRGMIKNIYTRLDYNYTSLAEAGERRSNFMTELSREIFESAQTIRGQITEDRRNFHQIPEVGTDLPKTSAYIKKRLDEMWSYVKI